MSEDINSLGVREYLKIKRQKISKDNPEIIDKLKKEKGIQTYEEAFKNMGIFVEDAQQLWAIFDELFQKELEQDESLLDISAGEFFESGKYQEIFDKARDKILKLYQEYNAIPATESNNNFSEIVRLNSIIPDTYFKANNKLSKEIIRDFINNGEIPLRVSAIDSKKEIITKAALSLDDKRFFIEGRAKFTPYDNEVCDALGTLWEAGNRIVTPAMIYRAMNGMTKSDNVSPQSINTVISSVEKSRKTSLKIDFTDEARAWKKNIKANYEGFLLICDIITVETGGKHTEAYVMHRKPILYDYAQITGQIISVQAQLLNTKDAVRSTNDVIVIRGYLLRQIEGMKSDIFNRSNKIAYEPIYNLLEIFPDNMSEAMYKKKTLATRQHINAILSEWKKQEYIKGHTTYKKGKTLAGVIIDFKGTPINGN